MKRKKSETTESTVPTAEVIIQTAAGLVGPLALAAADRLEAAAGRVGPLAHDAAGRLDPIAHNVADRVAPLAQQAADRVTPFAQQAAGRVGPYATQVGGYATQVGDTVGPYAALARQRAAQSAHDIIERWRPSLEEAMERVSPSIEAARERINDDLLPKLIAALEAAAAAPVVQEATKRGQATLAAAKGELALPEPQVKKRRWVKPVLIVAVVGGVLVVVVRKLLANQDADWQAARPTAPYSPPKPPTPPTAPASNGQGLAGSVAAPPESAETVETAEADPTPVAADDSVEQEPPLATPPEGSVPEDEAVEALLPEDSLESSTEYSTGDSIEDTSEIVDGVAPDADRSRYSGDDV